MTYAELLSWAEFYRLYPFDDYHRFHRPAALVAQALGGEDMRPLLEWLQPPSETADLSSADLNTIKAFGFNRKAG